MSTTPMGTIVERRNVEHKALATLEIKDAERGEVEAVFATLNVVDHDEDVIIDGAIQDGQKAKLSCYGHDAITADEAPVGIGRVHVRDNKAVFSGRYFLSTTRGREAFQTVKEMGADQEWSFGFRVVGAEVPSEAWKKKGARRIITKLDVFEVSPVLEGAGIGTRTTAVKSADFQPEPDPVAEDPSLVAAREEAEKSAKRALDMKLAEAARAEFALFQRNMRRSAR